MVVPLPEAAVLAVLAGNAGMPAGVADGVCWSRKRSLLESRAEGPLESRRRRWGGGGGRTTGDSRPYVTGVSCTGAQGHGQE